MRPSHTITKLGAQLEDYFLSHAVHYKPVWQHNSLTSRWDLRGAVKSTEKFWKRVLESTVQHLIEKENQRYVRYTRNDPESYLMSFCIQTKEAFKEGLT